MDNAVVILSGGQDSTICLHWAIKKYKKVYAVSFDYGQKHKIELMSAIEICRQTNIEHEIIKTQQILKSTSPLTDNTKELEEYDNYEEMDDIIGDRIEFTFVPMRNALFLTIGANFAEYPPCGKCHSCVLRAQGFKEAGVEDPLIVRAKKEGLM